MENLKTQSFLNGVPYLLLACSIITILNIFLIYSDGLAAMASKWQAEEYSHGYLVPIVALYIAWHRRADVVDKLLQQANKNAKQDLVIPLAILATAYALYIVGELSTIYIFIQYGFILTLFSITALILGTRNALILRNAFIYLIFMIPLPGMVLNNLSNFLRLVSSELGVDILRIMGVSVFLEGNLIDLGFYKLEVADACNGLRYLFPLVSFSFLVTCFYQRSWPFKAVIIVSALLITVIMNSFRIAVIGFTVDIWGIEAAEGFIHVFEGWVIFLACLALLALEIKVIDLIFFRSKKLPPALNLTSRIPRKFSSEEVKWFINSLTKPLTIGTTMLLIGALAAQSLSSREESIPNRIDFNLFPLRNDHWIGREQSLTKDIENVLNATDYFIADYISFQQKGSINLYMAYYESQRKGSSIHSPKSCIPGDGWKIHSFEPINPELESFKNHPIYKQLPHSINRAVIQKGSNQNLVHYWFDQRGRKITNEYLAKYLIVQDSILMNRTDGALIRLVTPILEGEEVEEADLRLIRFTKNFSRQWEKYIPN